MGTFVGHIDEACFFLLLAFWWMLNKFPRYILSQWDGTEFTSRISYPLPGRRKIPFEAIAKVGFPIAGFIGEIWSQGPAVLDKHGNFRKLDDLQHMSLYGIFIAHGVIDLMMSCRVPLPKNLDYLSAIAAFGWYGLAFSYHAHGHGKEAVETIIHILPISIMYVTAVTGVFEVFMPHSFLPPLVRIYCLLVLGSWFFHISFILFVPSPFPGARMNPAWNMKDYRNVHFIVALYGYHLIVHIFTITIGYLIAYGVLRLVRRNRNHFRQPLMNKDDIEDGRYLLVDE